MASVCRKEGFRYGISIFASWLVVVAFSAALVAAGGILVTVRNEFSAVPSEAVVVLGGFVGFVGVIVFGAGQTGLVYKVIADGVQTGVDSIDAQRWLAPEPTPEKERVPETTDACHDPVTNAAETKHHEAGSETTASTEATGAERERGDDDEAQISESPADSNQEGRRRAVGVEPGSDLSDESDDPTEGGPADSIAESATGGSPRDGSTADEPPGDLDRGPADDTTDAFESGGFEPASPPSETERSETDESKPAASETDELQTAEPKNSPVDVASESDIAEELGFGDKEGAERDAGDTPAEADPSQNAGEETSSTDDPLAPDSEFTPAETGEAADPAATRGEPLSGQSEVPESGANSAPEDSDSPPLTPEDEEAEEGAASSDSPTWTTGEGHMGGSNASEETDER